MPRLRIGIWALGLDAMLNYLVKCGLNKINFTLIFIEVIMLYIWITVSSHKGAGSSAWQWLLSVLFPAVNRMPYLIADWASSCYGDRMCFEDISISMSVKTNAVMIIKLCMAYFTCHFFYHVICPVEFSAKSGRGPGKCRNIWRVVVRLGVWPGAWLTFNDVRRESLCPFWLLSICIFSIKSQSGSFNIILLVLKKIMWNFNLMPK